MLLKRKRRSRGDREVGAVEGEIGLVKMALEAGVSSSSSTSLRLGSLPGKEGRLSVSAGC